MQRGVVTRWNSERGYGFIRPDEGGGDLFCHFTAIDTPGYRALAEGQGVLYELGEDKRGRIAAVVVRPLTWAE